MSRYINDSIDPSIINQNFPTLRNTLTERKNEMSFKLVVKDGEHDYQYDTQTGTYKNKLVDDVRTYDSLPEALAEFLYTVGDTYNENKVSLSFNPKKNKKDKK